MISRRLSLLAVLVLPTQAASPTPSQEAQAAPEIPIEAAQADYRYCPLLATGRGGAVALAWVRTDDGRDEALATVVARDGSFPKPVLLDQEVTGFLDLYTWVADRDGFRAVWNHSYYFREALRTAAIGLSGELREESHSLGNDEIRLDPRPSGGYIAIWYGAHGFSVQLRDSEGRSTGRVRRVPLDRVVGNWTFHQPDGSFLLVLIQGWRDDPFKSTIWTQSFTRDGAPVGRPTRLLSVRTFDNIVAALGWDGTLAVAAATRNGVILGTFTSDGLPLGPPVEIQQPASGLFLDSQAVAVAPSGNVLWIWSQTSDPQDLNAFRAREYDRHGRPLGPPFPLASDVGPRWPVLHCAQAIWDGDEWSVVWVAHRSGFRVEDLFEQIWLRRFAPASGVPVP